MLVLVLLGRLSGEEVLPEVAAVAADGETLIRRPMYAPGGGFVAAAAEEDVEDDGDVDGCGATATAPAAVVRAGPGVLPRTVVVAVAVTPPALPSAGRETDRVVFVAFAAAAAAVGPAVTEDGKPAPGLGPDAAAPPPPPPPVPSTPLLARETLTADSLPSGPALLRLSLLLLLTMIVLAVAVAVEVAPTLATVFRAVGPLQLVIPGVAVVVAVAGVAVVEAAAGVATTPLPLAETPGTMG